MRNFQIYRPLLLSASLLAGLSAYADGTPLLPPPGWSDATLPGLSADQTALLAAGDAALANGDYASALQAYRNVPLYLLPPHRADLYTVRMLQTALRCGLPEVAEPLVTQLEQRVASGDSDAAADYGPAASFYRAYLMYLDGDYAGAYPLFSRVAAVQAGTDETAPAGARRNRRRPRPATSTSRATAADPGSSLNPLYYMTQIEYETGRYGEAADHGRLLLERGVAAESRPELMRVTALSLFKQGDTNSARGLLEAYVDEAKRASVPVADDALYALGTLEYAAGDLMGAAEHFSAVSERRDAIGQGASLYLGQCASAAGDESAAAILFERAARMNFDPSVSETALYNHIAALTRGGRIPFANSIPLYEQFLATYPASRYAPAVRRSLADALYNERDYQRALAAIERLPHTTDLDRTRGRILYELGMQQLAGGDAAAALVSLEQAVSYAGNDTELRSEASLWLGDAAYGCGRYDRAATAYGVALGRGSTLGSGNAALARYNRGYSLYNLDRFTDAAPLFRQASSDRALPEAQRRDASLRLADCLFYTGDYKGARSLFSEAARSGDEYAEWRLALLSGAEGDSEAKVEALRRFASAHRDSRWAPGALLDLAETQVSLGNTAQGIKAYRELNDRYPASPEARRGSLALGRALEASGSPDAATEVWRRILVQWPASEEADSADEALQRLNAERGTLAEYAEWLESAPGGRSLEPDRMETLSFEAAERAWSDDETDIGRLEQYMRDYPTGRYAAPALLYIGRGQLASGKYDAAVRTFERLVDTYGGSPQATEGLMLRAETLEERFPARRIEACAAWMALERAASPELAPVAWSGIMRTTSDPKQRVEYARRLRQTGGLSAEEADRARLYEALGAIESGDKAEAASGERELAAMAGAPLTESGARAAVELGQRYLDTGRPKEAVELLSRFTDSGTPHSYWLARGFIALADAYEATGRRFLAVEYLKSLRDNYPGTEPDIRDAISTRLNTLNK